VFRVTPGDTARYQLWTSLIRKAQWRDLVPSQRYTGGRIEDLVIKLTAKNVPSGLACTLTESPEYSRPTHKLAGPSYVNKILILDTAKGGVASAWMLYEMKSRGVVPQALVFNSVNPILVQGAALANLPMLAKADIGRTMVVGP